MALGAALAVAGATPLFAWWRGAVAGELFGARDLPDDVARLAGLTDAILGASIAGKWLAAWWLARVPLAARARWAWQASVAGLATWWLIDSSVSAAMGAPSNIILVNCAPLVIAGPLLLRLRRQGAPHPRVPRARGWWALELVCALNLGLGLAIAIGGLQLPPWVTYLDGWLGAPASPDAIVWQRFVAGPIGGTIAAQFLMLGWAARRASGEAWVRRAIVTSVLAWFAIDTALSLAVGATFNVGLVNLPCLALVLAATAAARSVAVLPGQHALEPHDPAVGAVGIEPR
ncbi:MAG: hypothetical protein K8W52_18215 [Deltaproteobacteria bacterium]|nr:hypothetical protein [Deltaproteobacteria bacterium]